MANLTLPAESKKFLLEVKNVFLTGRIFRKYDRHIVFVCGGKTSDERTFRSQFLKLAKDVAHIVPLLSEQTYNQPIFDEPFRFVNLQIFERVIAAVSGCVLVFPESPGSFAEIGYFSHDPSIRRKILVANDHQEGSFLTYGPLAAISRDTDFEKVVLSDKTPMFEQVVERLSLLKSRTNRSKVEIGRFNKLDYDEQLIVVAAILRLLLAADMKWLITAIRFIFKEAKEDEIKYLISILVALGEIDAREGIFVTKKTDQSLFEIEHSELQEITSHAAYVYRRKMAHLFDAWTAYDRLSRISPETEKGANESRG